MEQQVELVPWAWIKAVNQILSGYPNKDPDELPVLLLPWLYLSDEFHCIWQPDKLQELGITHVLTVNQTSQEEVDATRDKLKSRGIQEYHAILGAQDTEGYDMIGHHWEECHEFFQNAKNHHGKIVVSCVAGVNRSGLMAAAAMLLLEEDANLLDVVRNLKNKRGIVLSNFSFQKQLCLLAAKEGKLGDKPAGFTDEPLPDDFEPKRLWEIKMDW